MLYILHLLHIAGSVHQLRISDMAKEANSTDSGHIEMKFGLLDGREDVEYTGVGFEVISKLFAT